MAISNKIISNSKTGQVIRFLQTAKDTNGALLEMECGFGPKSKEPPTHYHPYQEEDFTVLSGELTVKIDAKTITLKKGDVIFTGTPAGVGPVKIGDRLEGFLEQEKMFDFEVK